MFFVRCEYANYDSDHLSPNMLIIADTWLQCVSSFWFVSFDSLYNEIISNYLLRSTILSLRASIFSDSLLPVRADYAVI